jgi:broad specificity phosphatase PhoE
MDTKIYLMRHGESVDDIEDCYGGIADFPLTEAGKQTAEALGQKLHTAGISILYSSPYRRALETAEVVAQIVKCEVKIIPELRERNSYGVISGVNKDTAKEIFAQILNGLEGKPGDYYAGERIPGDEAISEFDSRVQSAFRKIVEDARTRNTIGIITHGNVTRSIYKNILGVTGKVDLDLLAITVIKHGDGKFLVEESEGVKVA